MSEAGQAVAAVAVPKSRFRTLGVGLLTAAVAVLYYDTLARLVRNWWEDPNFSHGFLVPVFVLFVIWQRRNQLVKLPGRPSVWGFLLIVGSALMLIVGTLGAELFLARCSFIVLLAGLIIYLVGAAHFRVLLFPWACLFMAVPPPAVILNEITFPLQLMAAQLAAQMLRLFRVPVLREGNIIQIPSMSMEMADACSGIRSLVSLVLLAVVFGYVVHARRSWRVVLTLLAVPIAILANGIRITTTGIVAQYWNPERAEGFFHEFSGLFVFAVSLVAFFFVDRALRVLSRLRIPGMQGHE